MEKLFKFLPIWILLALVGIYAFSNHFFVNCGAWSGCREIESVNVSAVSSAAKTDKPKVWAHSSDTAPCFETAKTNANTNTASDATTANTNSANKATIAPVAANKVHDLNCVAVLLEEKQRNLDEKSKLVKNRLTEFDKKDDEIIENQKAQNDAAAPETTTGTTPTPSPTLKEKRAKLEAEKKNLGEDLTRLKTNEQNAAGEVKAVREQIAGRYSKRLTFMFFTAAFVLLCLAAVLFSVYAIREALKDKGKLMRIWQTVTAVCAVGFFLVVLIAPRNYLAVVEPMFMQSIASNGDISIDFIHFFNCFGFGTIVWVVGAVSAVFYAVMTGRGKFTFKQKRIEILNALLRIKSDEYTAAEKALDTTKIESLGAEKSRLENRINALTTQMQRVFAPYKRLITIILYIGALMLFTGIVRLKLLADWHLLFVETNYKPLLEGFFNSSITVQAAFYTILLAVVYLPVVYAIPPDKAMPAEPEKNFLEKIGLPVSTDFLTKFIAVFSPLLAPPVVEGVKDFLGLME